MIWFPLHQRRGPEPSSSVLDSAKMGSAVVPLAAGLQSWGCGMGSSRCAGLCQPDSSAIPLRALPKPPRWLGNRCPSNGNIVRSPPPRRPCKVGRWTRVEVMRRPSSPTLPPARLSGGWTEGSCRPPSLYPAARRPYRTLTRVVACCCDAMPRRHLLLPHFRVLGGGGQTRTGVHSE